MKSQKSDVELATSSAQEPVEDEMVEVELDDDGRPRRSGTFLTASAHAITAVIGSGVLSLAWSVAQLGWVAGPLVNFGFAVITYLTSILLADSYRYMDPVSGRRLYTYMDAVKAYLGRVETFVCGLVQYINLFGVCVGYTITAATSMAAVKRAVCFHEEGHNASCKVSSNIYMLMFGLIQIVFSQIPNLAEAWWLSVVAAVMSFSYAGIGLVLSIVKTFHAGHSHGTLGGSPIGPEEGEYSHAEKIWKTFSAMGDIAFAYGFIIILINIQDTLRRPPAENRTMRKVALVTNVTCTLFYLSVGCFGYAAFGNAAPGNLLTGFGFYEPYQLVVFGNLCIVVHLCGAFQVFAQPLYAFVEVKARRCFFRPGRNVKTFAFSLPYVGLVKVNLGILVWRSVFVGLTTFIATLLPFFNSIMGILGALGFFPLSVYFPVRIYMMRVGIQSFSWRWWFLWLLMLACLLVSLCAFLGSAVDIKAASKHYIPFDGNVD